VDRQVIFPRGRVRYTEWVLERRVLLACVLGILCFAVGFLAAGTRLHAGNPTVKAPPAISVQSSPAAQSPTKSAQALAPEISVVPISGPRSVFTEDKNNTNVSGSTNELAERPRRKKKRVVPKPKIESEEPVIVYEPPNPESDEVVEESFKREVERDPEMEP